MKIIQTETSAKGQPLTGLLLTMRSANQQLHYGIVTGPYADWAWPILSHAFLYTQGDVNFRKLVAENLLEATKDLPFNEIEPSMSAPGVLYLIDPND